MGIFFKSRLNFCLMKSLQTSAECLFLFSFWLLVLPAFICSRLAFFLESQYVSECVGLVTIMSICGENRRFNLLPKSETVSLANQNQIFQWYLSTVITAGHSVSKLMKVQYRN